MFNFQKFTSIFVARRRLMLVVIMVSVAVGSASAQDTVRIKREDQQTLAVMSYTPKGKTCLGIALISPGAGGSEDGYRYLGEAMSSLGYLAVVMGHQESGRQALRGQVRNNGLRVGLLELITDSDAYRGRFMDIAAARNWATSKCSSKESILIGHSMGAATVMIEAGAKNKGGVKGSDSFDVYIALSPQGSGSIFPEKAWSEIKKPVLLMTGTRDTELGGDSWQTRAESFDNMPAGCKWLGVIDGATHMNFAGRGSDGVVSLTIQLINQFLNGVHQKDCKAPVPREGVKVSAR